MASSVKKIKPAPENETQLQLLYGDDAITKYWNSSLFNTVYLRHDISDKHSNWKNEDDLDFQNFMNTIRNLASEYKDREKELSNWSETETINNWVKHVLHSLGWTNNCTGVQNPFLEETSFRYDGKTYRTDILIVDHPKEKQYINQAKGDDKLKEARQSILMPVEVKYWQRLEEYRQGKKEEKGRTDNESDDISKSTTPNEQTVQYMDILKKNWGILTDGARWRLFNSDLSSEDAERFYEFNFSALFQALSTEETEADTVEITEAAKYFYFFFSKFAFFPKNESERPFVDEVLQYSKKYVNRVEEDLKIRFVKAMNIVCNGFFKATTGAKKSDLTNIRNVSESTLFNILFIKSLESRNILPMDSTDYKKISLSSIVDKIERFDPEKDNILNVRELERTFKKGNGNSFEFKANGTELHDRIVRLTQVIHKGASARDNFGFEIAGFKESIFSQQEWDIFCNSKISNHDWVKILFELGYTESESMNRTHQQIPYSFFTPRQLGSIYESFLEFQIKVADEDLIFEDGKWVKPLKRHSKKLPHVEKGDLHFAPDNSEKKASGSFYTPDPIVQFVTKQALQSVVENRSPKEILEIKVCDPAMGSGHFISYALNYLTFAYLNSLNAQDSESKEITVAQAKHKILESCIYGIDLNPRAVKLAKLSLWLSSATAGATLENLDDQLFHGNAIISDLNGYSDSFSWKKNIFENKHISGFDCIIGNPPWGANIDKFAEYFHDKHENVIKNYLDIYKLFVAIGLENLNSDGVMGFIVPNTFIAQPRYQDLRSYLLEKKSVYKVINLGDGVFEGVVAPSAVLIAGKHASQSYLYSNLAVNNKFNGDLDSIDWQEFDVDVILESPDKSFIQQRRMKNNEHLAGEVLEIKDAGIQYHRSGIGLKNKGGNDLYERLFKESSKSFKKSEPVWYGKMINDYYISDRTDEYFNRNYKEVLKDNESVSFSEKSFNVSEKIVWRQTAPYIKATIDTKKRWFRNTIQCCWIKEEFQDRIDLYYLLGVLNSSYMRMIYCSIVNEAAGKVFPQVKLTHVKKLPIRVPDKATQNKVRKLVEKLIDDNVESADKSIMEKIDLIVSEIYEVKGQELRELEVFKKPQKPTKKAA